MNSIDNSKDIFALQRNLHVYDYLAVTISLLAVIYVSPIGRQDVFILSFINYAAAAITILALMIRPSFPKDGLLIMLVCAGLFSIFSEYFSLYNFSIYFVQLLFYVLSSRAFKNSAAARIILKLFLVSSIFISTLEIAFLYYLSLLVDFTSLNAFVAEGMPYGFNKGTIALFLVYPLFYLLVSRRLYLFFIFLLYVSPALFSMRMGFVAFLLTIFIYIALRMQWSGKGTLFILWMALLVLSVVAINMGVFDRLPTYMIALEVLFRNPFGLGIYQYSDYIQNNYEIIFNNHSAYISEGFNEIWNSGESMFGELIASFGVFGVIVIYQYIRLMVSAVNIVQLLEHKSAALLMLYFFMIFSGIAHDYSKLDIIFYFLCGGVVGLVSRFR